MQIQPPRPTAAPFFLADDRALDFVNSRLSPNGVAMEWLSDGAAFRAWMQAAGLAPGPLPEWEAAALDPVAGRARDLREWLRGFVQAHAGAPLGEVAVVELAPLNAVLAEGGARQITVVSGKPHWQTRPTWRSPADLLQPVAEAAGELLCSANFELVRPCQGAGCSIWFLDISKSHQRRWCSMATCGNRAKAAQHRARARATA